MNSKDEVPYDETENVELSDEELETSNSEYLIKKATKLRDRRNELNELANEFANKRDDLNAKTREKIDEAQEHREKRDELNEQVQEHKNKRNELNAEADELFDEAEELKQDMEFDSDKSIEEFKQEIDDLEKKIEELEETESHLQTETSDAENERELIKEKRKKLAEKKKKLVQINEFESLVEEAEEVRSEASQHHQKVTELADKAQEHHNQMIEAYREADDIRDEADEVTELFVEAQDAADRHHEDFVRVQKVLRELNLEEQRETKSTYLSVVGFESLDNFLEKETFVDVDVGKFSRSHLELDLTTANLTTVRFRQYNSTLSASWGTSKPVDDVINEFVTNTGTNASAKVEAAWQNSEDEIVREEADLSILDDVEWFPSACEYVAVDRGDKELRWEASKWSKENEAEISVSVQVEDVETDAFDTLELVSKKAESSKSANSKFHKH